MAKSSFAGELLHFNATRMRVTGVGNLKLSFNSLDEINTVNLTSIPMSVATNREPTVIANYIDQRGYLKFGTTEINETFSISKITIFIRPVATGYPQ